MNEDDRPLVYPVGWLVKIVSPCGHLAHDGHNYQRWSDLFAVRYEVLLYDLTSTYFESGVPDDESDPRRFGYSRDKRGDCVQVVVAR